jgi:hypothetical protein
MNILRMASLFLVTAFILIVCGPAASAQGFGVKGGVVFPEFSSEDIDFDNHTGTEFGFFFGGNRSGLLGWQGEANWIRKSADALNTDIRIDYFQLAGLLRLNIGSHTATKGLNFYGFAGPGFDFKIGDSVEGFSVSDPFNDFDIGLIFGGGVEVRRLIFEGRYERGLRQINNDLASTTDIKSHNFAVLVGFRFR